MAKLRERGYVQGQEVIQSSFDAMWNSPVNLGDPQIIAAALKSAGLGSASLLPLAQSEAAKTRLKANTDGAVARGMLGAPTFYVDGKMSFGQDRLDFVEAQLQPVAA